jgi:hypothetical protein
VMSAVRYAHDRVVADGGEAGDLSRYVGDAGSGMANDDVLAPIREGRAMAALDGTATFAIASTEPHCPLPHCPLTDGVDCPLGNAPHGTCPLGKHADERPTDFAVAEIDLTDEAAAHGIPPFPTMAEGVAQAVEAGVPPERAATVVAEAHLDVATELTAAKGRRAKKATPAIYEQQVLDHVCADCGQEYTMEQASSYDACIDCGGPIVPITDAEPSA